MTESEELNYKEFCINVCKNYTLVSQFICNKYNLSERDLKLLMFLNGVGRYTLFTIQVTYKHLVDMTHFDNSRFVKKGYVHNVRVTNQGQNNRLINRKYHVYSLTNESQIILKELYRMLMSTNIIQNLQLKIREVNKIASEKKKAEREAKEIKQVIKLMQKEEKETGKPIDISDIFMKDIKIMPDHW